MKYDVLNPFKDHLYQTMTKNTARKYFSSIVKLFENKPLNNIADVDRQFIEQEIQKCRTRNDFSAAKNAIKRMKEFYPELDIPDEKFFTQCSMKKRNWNKKPKKIIYLEPTRRKINQIKNEKLRYAYRLGLVSGLRVSELASLTAGDIIFSENEVLKVNVRHGKGGSNGIVECQPDQYLYSRLKEYVKDMKPEDKLFYSEAYLRERADAMGMECHDLRRICAITYRDRLKQEMPIAEANLRVQEMLRHKRFSTTKRYLFNRKLVVKRFKIDYVKSIVATEPEQKIQTGESINNVVMITTIMGKNVNAACKVSHFDNTKEGHQTAVLTYEGVTYPNGTYPSCTVAVEVKVH